MKPVSQNAATTQNHGTQNHEMQSAAPKASHAAKDFGHENAQENISKPTVNADTTPRNTSDIQAKADNPPAQQRTTPAEQKPAITHENPSYETHTSASPASNAGESRNRAPRPNEAASSFSATSESVSGNTAAEAAAGSSGAEGTSGNIADDVEKKPRRGRRDTRNHRRYRGGDKNRNRGRTSENSAASGDAAMRMLMPLIQIQPMPLHHLMKLKAQIINLQVRVFITIAELLQQRQKQTLHHILNNT